MYKIVNVLNVLVYRRYIKIRVLTTATNDAETRFLAYAGVNCRLIAECSFGHYP